MNKIPGTCLDRLGLSRIALWPILVLLLGLPGVAPASIDAGERGSGQTLVVGDDEKECDFESLQDAMDAAQHGDTIIMTGEGLVALNDELVITKSVTLKGGFEDCLLDFTADPPLVLFAFDDHRAVQVYSPEGESLNVEFQDIGFGGGTTESASATGRSFDADGAGLLVLGGHTIIATNVRIGLNNATGNGGAVALIETDDGAPELTISGSSRLFSSSAEGHGGGLYCQGGGIHIDNDTGIHLNTAGSNGGGIYLDDCQLEFGSGGRDLPGSDDPSGIVENEAEGFGGGLFATGQSPVRMDGDDPDISEQSHLPVEMVDNSALNGGAIYLEGAETEAELVNVIIDSNQAESGAAAITVIDEASLAMESDDDCRIRKSSLTCSKIISNSMTDPVAGSIVSVSSDAYASFHQTEITGNELDHGLVFHVHGSDTSDDDEVHSLVLHNSLVANNQFLSEGGSESSVFGLFNSSSASLEWSTVSTQSSPVSFTGVIETQVAPFEHMELHIEGLLIDQPDTASLVSGGAGETRVTRAACIVAREITSIENHSGKADLVTTLIEDDPGLVDPHQGNHRLSDDSPALDACAQDLDPDPPLTSSGRDIDHHLRKILLGAEYDDVGAFDQAGEIILRDRFEGAFQ